MPTDRRHGTLITVLESLGENAWQNNLKTNELQTSAMFWESLGYDAGSLPATLEAARELIHPIDAKVAGEEVELHLTTREPLELEVRVRAASGEWRFIRARGCVTEWSAHGQPAVVGGTLNDITQELLTAREQRHAEDMISHLSKREMQVLNCLLTGAANKNIAYALGLSQRTIEGYRARLMDKLDVRGVGELVQVAPAACIPRPGPSSCGLTKEST